MRIPESRTNPSPKIPRPKPSLFTHACTGSEGRSGNLPPPPSPPPPCHHHQPQQTQSIGTRDCVLNCFLDARRPYRLGGHVWIGSDIGSESVAAGPWTLKETKKANRPIRSAWIIRGRRVGRVAEAPVARGAQNLPRRARREALFQFKIIIKVMKPLPANDYLGSFLTKHTSHLSFHDF